MNDIVAGESSTSFFVSFSSACKLLFLTILQAQIDFLGAAIVLVAKEGFDGTIASKPSSVNGFLQALSSSMWSKGLRYQRDESAVCGWAYLTTPNRS